MTQRDRQIVFRKRVAMVTQFVLVEVLMLTATVTWFLGVW